jgi:hypothetical protein
MTDMNAPEFFLKEHFYAKLLPGYATLILANYFFNFSLVSDDILATVTFIVEGAVIGYILCSVTSVIWSLITSSGEKDYNYEKFRKDYAKIRMKATERQIGELDSTLSAYQFCISTGSALILLSLIKAGDIYIHDNITFPLLVLLLSALGVGVLLLFIQKYEYEEYHYTFWELHEEIIGNQEEATRHSNEKVG